MKWCVLALAMTGCLSLHHNAQPTPRAQVLAISGAFAISAAAITGAKLVHDAPIALQTGVAIGTSVVPMAVVFLGEEPGDPPTTPGGIYSALGASLLSALGAAMSIGVPIVGTAVAGEDTRRPGGAAWGASGGVVLGALVVNRLARHMPKWARVIVGAALVGSTATLGYQLGGGGPP